MAEEVMTPESVHRSPHSFEIVEPTKGTANSWKGPGTSDERQRQRRVTSELREHPVTEAAETDSLRLFSSEDNPANIAIIHEKPEHRFIIYLKARGLSNREVCQKLGYTDAWMSQIVRQPWFRLRVVQEMREAGMNKIAKLLEGAAEDSVYTLLEIRDDQDAPKAVRRQAADSLLDRWLGKPTVHVSHDDDRVPSTPEIAQVDTELQQIEQQLKEQHGSKEGEVQH